MDVNTYFFLKTLDLMGTTSAVRAPKPDKTNYRAVQRHCKIQVRPKRMNARVPKPQAKHAVHPLWVRLRFCRSYPLWQRPWI